MLSERLIGILADSFFKILIPGLTVTIPLTVISFALAMVIAIVVALIQFAKVRVLKDIARFYVWVIRGTPLLVQLFVVFYGLPNIGILINPFPAAIIVFIIYVPGDRRTSLLPLTTGLSISTKQWLLKNPAIFIKSGFDLIDSIVWDFDE